MGEEKENQEELTEEERAIVEGDPDSADETALAATVKRAAALAASGATKYKVMTSLKLTQYAVNKLWKDERFKQIVAEIGEDAVSASKAITRNQMAKLSSLAMKAIEFQLKKNNLMAAVTVLRAIGVETEKDKGGESGGFSLVLATAQPDKKTTIEVVDKTKEE
jgi:hypothetical protein